MIDGIAAHHRVIAFDNRGVGATGGSVPSTVEQMGTDAIAFIRALGLHKVDLLGFSLGGGVAQIKAIRHVGRSQPDDLSVVTHPVLVVNGDNDLMVASSHSADMARRLPNAQLEIYPNSGHGGIFQHYQSLCPTHCSSSPAKPTGYQQEKITMVPDHRTQHGTVSPYLHTPTRTITAEEATYAYPELGPRQGAIDPSSESGRLK